jgi:Tfp pilus assembly major pilin PilA
MWSLNLKRKVEQQQMQALDAITQWEGECNELQTTITNLESSKDEILRTLVEAVNVKLKDDIKWIRMLDSDYDGLNNLNIVDETPCTEISLLLSTQGKINDTKIGTGIQRLKNEVESHSEINKTSGNKPEIKRRRNRTIDGRFSGRTSLVY